MKRRDIESAQPIVAQLLLDKGVLASTSYMISSQHAKHTNFDNVSTPLAELKYARATTDNDNKKGTCQTRC